VKRFGRTGLILVLVGGVAALAVAAVAMASTTKKSASVQVCVLLPDTKSSVRWTQFDPKYIGAALKKANVTYSMNNALNDPSKQTAQAQACLAAGAKGVIEVSLDNGSASAIEKLFTSKGGWAIDYDRQVTGGTAAVYDAFDGTAVGAAQANGIIAAMKAKHTYKPSSIVAELWGGQTDQNAFWFKSGNDKVLNPLFKQHKLKKGPQKFVPDWDANNAATIFNQMLVKTSNNVQGIIAANDNIAGAVTMLIGRFFMILPMLAIAGNLAKKKYVPPSLGTFPVTTPLFSFLLISVILIVGALTFFPAWSLGPIVEHLLMQSGRLF